MSGSNLMRCTNAHLFSIRKYGYICPYCNVDMSKVVDPVAIMMENSRKRLNEDGSFKVLDDSEKVCGWLVCVDGIRSGRSYIIRRGKNYIGRADNMDIQVLGDITLDLKVHAGITYDPSAKGFTLVPGSGHGLVYLNGNVIWEPVAIFSYDKIEMGSSEFVLMEFTGKRFTWEEGLL